MPDNNSDDLDITNHPRDSRMQFENIRRSFEEETPADTEGSQAPYDVAAPGTPEHHIITKGERERPGSSDDKTATDIDAASMKTHDRERKPQDESQSDGLLQTNQVDREGAASFRRGIPGEDDLQQRNTSEMSPDDFDIDDTSED